MSEERYVTKRAVFHDIENYIYTHPIINDNELFALISMIPESDVVPVPKEGIGELSDGYHTFNGLYYQRMMLFAALVNVYKDIAWKSWRHEDGEPCFGKDNYFIVGIDTPEGSYTYHYHGEYWDLFNCKELSVAKHWDGHTEKDVTRLLSLSVEKPVVRGEWIWKKSGEVVCSECNDLMAVVGNTEDFIAVKSYHNFCPNCGADMRANNG